jgi:glyoxylase-like metal-dependent hydrolase (beta-lactamase superfamily II)
VEDSRFTFARSAPAALPRTAIRTEQSLQLTGTRVTLTPYAPGRTGSDVVAHFADADVISAGDKWWNGIYPFIDSSPGGRMNGMIAAMELTLAVASPGTLIVPGHGPVGSQVEMGRDRDMLVDIRDRGGRAEAPGALHGSGAGRQAYATLRCPRGA